MDTSLSGDNTLGLNSAQFDNNKQRTSSEPMSTEDVPNIIEQEAACTSVAEENQASGVDESGIKISMSKCVLCSKQLLPDDNAQLLECLHATCTRCIQAKLVSVTDVNELSSDNKYIQCPLCRVDSQPQFLIKNRFFSKLFEDDPNALTGDETKDSEDDKKCTNCEETIATSWCTDCKEFICDVCVSAHQKLKITKDHTIKPKEEIQMDASHIKGTKDEDPLYCHFHPHELLSLFCQTCDTLTCRDCQLSGHREHKYKFNHEMVAETRASIKTLLKEVSYKRELLKSAMNVIHDRQESISEKNKSLNEEITQLVVQLTEAIKSRGKQLLKRLKEVCDQKLNTLNEKKEALDQLAKLTDHCINFVNFALEKGTDNEILYSKKCITNHLQRIKGKRADIPNPEIPVRIHLSMDRMTDLIKVISTIGAIYVDGSVYPRPAESNVTPLTNSGEQSTAEMRQPMSCAVMENVNSQANMPQLVPNQSAANMPYLNQPLNIPISSPQQLLLPNHFNNPQGQANLIQHYTMQQQQQQQQQQRASPQGQRMPFYNGRTLTPHQQMLIQRSGLGNCHQQVTSSTHPLQQQPISHVTMSDTILNPNASLRGLLAHNPPAYRPPVSNPVQQQQQQYRFPPRYPQRYPSTSPQPQQRPSPQHSNYNPTASLLNMQARQQNMMPAYMQQQQQMQQSSGARWHIPQGGQQPVNAPYPSKSPLQQSLTVNDNTYKITLKNQSTLSGANSSVMQKNTGNNTMSPQTITEINSNTLTIGSMTTVSPSSISQMVSSSMPKTPSPASSSDKIACEDAQNSLDKFCQKSLNDLMMTIAKLDSNGIVVIPEAQKNQLESQAAQVDSSTDEVANAVTDNSTNNEVMSMIKDDPNEDWCAVCMDGGDAVLCCDKCPKVFHLYCHIPKLSTFPSESETWQCMLCTNVLDCSEDPPDEKKLDELSPLDLRIAQRIVLELYCQYEQSLPFREIVPPEHTEYHQIIKKPIALDVIRAKLDPKNENHYTDLKQVMADIRLMFRNAFTFNAVDSQVHQEAKNLEEFFEKLLLTWAPAYAFDDCIAHVEGDDDSSPPNKKYRRIINN